jgi:hypothetical protein
LEEASGDLVVVLEDLEEVKAMERMLVRRRKLTPINTMKDWVWIRKPQLNKLGKLLERKLLRSIPIKEEIQINSKK